MAQHQRRDVRTRVGDGGERRPRGGVRSPRRTRDGSRRPRDAHRGHAHVREQLHQGDGSRPGRSPSARKARRSTSLFHSRGVGATGPTGPGRRIRRHRSRGRHGRTGIGRTLGTDRSHGCAGSDRSNGSDRLDRRHRSNRSGWPDRLRRFDRGDRQQRHRGKHGCGWTRPASPVRLGPPARQAPPVTTGATARRRHWPHRTVRSNRRVRRHRSELSVLRGRKRQRAARDHCHQRPRLAGDGFQQLRRQLVGHDRAWWRGKNCHVLRRRRHDPTGRVRGSNRLRYYCSSTSVGHVRGCSEFHHPPSPLPGGQRH